MVGESIAYAAELSVGMTGPELAELCGLRDSPWERELHRPFRFVDGRTTGVSTCGLVAEGCWWAAGVILPPDWRPYKPSLEREKSIARAIGFASKLGALRSFNGSSLPQSGDYVVIGEGLRTHALTCLSSTDGLLVSVDGGQVDAPTGLQTVKKRERKLVVEGKSLFAVGTGDKRRVVYWIDVDKLPNIWAAGREAK
jgi:hypothetical protein